MKKSTLFLIGLASSTCIVFVSGCSTPKVIETQLEPYAFNYKAPFEDEYDSNMKIDGVLDEPSWVGKNYLYFSEYNVDIEVTTFFTDLGVYIGGKASDLEMTYYGRFDTKNNSGLNFYLARSNQQLMQNSEIMLLQLDAKDRKSYYQDRFSGATTTTGNLNTHTLCTMTFELFVSWKELGCDFVPREVKMVPAYRYVYRSESATNIERHTITPTFGESTYMSGYFTFNKNGYAKPDIAGCPLGNAKNGVCKSDGWDLSHYADSTPYVSSTFRNCQSIYFKNVCAENFVAEVDVEIEESMAPSYNPKIGLIAHAYGFMNFRTMYVRGMVDGQLYYNSKTMRVAEMTYYPNRTYVENDYVFQQLSSPLADTNNMIHLKMVKYKDTLMMFVGNTLVYSETEDWYKGEMAPGLFAMDVRANFYNYRAAAFSDEDLYSYLGENKVSIVSIPSKFSGGVISADSTAINYGGSVTLDIKPNVGYILSDISINGDSYFNDYAAKISDGKYVVSNLPRSGLLQVDAKFKKIASKTGPYNYGSLVSSSDLNKTIPYAEIMITSNISFLFFKDQTASNGSYYFDYLPAAGDSILTYAGTNYIADGYYYVDIQADGYRELQFVLYVDTNGYHLDGPSGELLSENHKITLQNRVVGGSVSSNNFSYVSDLTGWDLSKEKENIITANRGSSNNPLYFSNVVSTSAVIKMTVQDDTPVGTGYDPQPSLGISMQTGGFRLAVMLDGTNVRLLPDFQWYNDSEHLISTNNMFKTNDKKPIGFMLIKDGTFVACLVSPNNDGNYKIAYAGIWEDFGNLPIAYGLYSRSSGLVNNVFSNYSIKTDRQSIDAVIDEYLSSEMVISSEEHGSVVVKDSTGTVFHSGDPISSGKLITVTADADSGYYVYGIKVGNEFVPLKYSNNYAHATYAFPYVPGKSIEVFFDLQENRGKPIKLSMSPQLTDSHLTAVCTTSEAVSGLHYSTKSNIDSGSLEGNIQIMMATKENDYSSFESLEYELIEGFTDEKMVPYVVDNNGNAFKLGGERNKWKAKRIVGNTTSTVESTNWQGFSISGGAHATYSVSLKDPMYFDSSISNKFGSTSSTASLNINNISYLGIQSYAWYNNHWDFVLLAIRGVKSNGEKVLLFDGSQTSVKEINGNKSLVCEDNDAMLWWDPGTSGKTNYQELSAIVNQPVKCFVDGGKTWKIHHGTNGDGYSWNNITWPTESKLVNLQFYDAIAFDVDFSTSNLSEEELFELLLELRFGDYDLNSANKARCDYYYLIDLNGNVSRLMYTEIPSDFKGTIVALFQDFTSYNILSNHIYNIFTSTRLILNTSESNHGSQIDIWNFRIIDNGKDLVNP